MIDRFLLVDSYNDSIIYDIVFLENAMKQEDLQNKVYELKEQYGYDTYTIEDIENGLAKYIADFSIFDTTEQAIIPIENSIARIYC